MVREHGEGGQLRWDLRQPHLHLAHDVQAHSHIPPRCKHTTAHVSNIGHGLTDSAMLGTCLEVLRQSKAANLLLVRRVLAGLAERVFAVYVLASVFAVVPLIASVWLVLSACCWCFRSASLPLLSFLQLCRSKR